MPPNTSALSPSTPASPPSSPVLSKPIPLAFAGAANNWTGTLDLTTHKLIVESTALSKPAALASLQNQAAFAKNHAAGITSSTLPANYGIAVIDNAITSFATFGGLGVDNNSLLVSPELLGDANADGHVDLTDLSTVLNSFGSATLAWTSGNFDYQPTIDLTDLSDVLNNFGLSNPNASSAALISSVPEPLSLAILAPAALLLCGSRRRS